MVKPTTVHLGYESPRNILRKIHVHNIVMDNFGITYNRFIELTRKSTGEDFDAKSVTYVLKSKITSIEICELVDDEDFISAKGTPAVVLYIDGSSLTIPLSSSEESLNIYTIIKAWLVA